MSKEKLKISTILSYAFATGSGYQIMGSLVGTYLMVFLTDTFGVPAGAAGIIMLIASIWDAVNDPMMGTIADRTKSRWGRYRPWLLFVPVLLTVVVVLLFACPSLSATGKIIWTAVFYILYGMLRTAIEIPSGALINAITDEPSERSKLINSYTVVMGIFTTITTSFALTFVTLFGGGNVAKGYMIVVGIAGVLTIITCWLCFATTKEKKVEEKEQTSIKSDVKQLFKYKELIIVIIVWLASFTAFQTMMASSVYYILYCVCRPDLIEMYMLDISLIGVLGIIFLMPILIKLFKKTERAFAASQIMVAVCSLIVLFSNGNLVILFAFSGIGAMFATTCMPFSAIIMSEMTDYVLLKSNKSLNGTMAALKGFANKAAIALSSAIIGLTLSGTGYIAGAIGQEPQAVITGISLVRFISPVICAVIIILALTKYPITDKIRDEIKNIYENKAKKI